MIEADNLPDPLDDPDIGYGNCAAVADLPDRIDLERLKSTIIAVVTETQQALNEHVMPGEVEDPAEGEYPTPEDMYGDEDDEDDDPSDDSGDFISL